MQLSRLSKNFEIIVMEKQNILLFLLAKPMRYGNYYY